MSTHRPVRLTYDAAWLARWILGRHGTITADLVILESQEFGAGARTVGVLIDALQRTGEHGVRALSHYEEQT